MTRGGKRPGAGRRKLAKSSRTVPTTVRLSPAARKMLVDLADKLNTSQADVIGRALVALSRPGVYAPVLPIDHEAEARIDAMMRTAKERKRGDP